MQNELAAASPNVSNVSPNDQQQLSDYQPKIGIKMKVSWEKKKIDRKYINYKQNKAHNRWKSLS